MSEKRKAIKSGPCPVCGRHQFKTWDEMCPICYWSHDPVQEENPDEDACQNNMSLNQAREAWAKGEEVL